MIASLYAFRGAAIASRYAIQRSFSRSCRLRASQSSPKVTAYKAPQSATKSKGIVYPESLLVWNAGLFKITLVGFIRLTPVLFFAWSCVIWAPRYVYAPDQPSWKAIPAVLAGAVPVIFVTAVTIPFVAQIRVQVPRGARISKAALKSWSKNIPVDTPMEIVTTRFIGLQRTQTCRFKDLRPRRERWLDFANLERIPEKKGLVSEMGLWEGFTAWVREPTHKLYVGGEEGMRRSRAPGVWEEVLKQIRTKPER